MLHAGFQERRGRRVNVLFAEPASPACASYGAAVLLPMHVRFAWDIEKAASNEIKHGVTFGLALHVFDDEARVDLDVSRPEDGETRRKAVGRIGGKLFCLVYTMRGEVCWVISARRTNKAEDRLYDRFLS